MNEADNFALVPKPPGALEKAEPGAKRILSGMVAETLALAQKKPSSKPILSVLMDNEITSDLFATLIKSKLGEQFEVRFTHFESAGVLLELAEQQAFDLIVLYWFGSFFSAPHQDFGPNGVLTRLGAKYGKRIIVYQGKDLSEQCTRAGVGFLETPFTIEQAQAAIQLALDTHRHSAQGVAEHSLDLPKTRPLRIVIVNDEQGPMHSMRVVLRDFKGVTLLLFENASEGWRELSQTDPDLLILDTRMPGLSGAEIAGRLLDRRATFPIIVTCTYEPDEQWVREYARLGLNITFLPLPFDIADFRSRVATALKIPCDRIGTPGPVTQSPQNSPDTSLRPVDLDNLVLEGKRLYCSMQRGRGVRAGTLTLEDIQAFDFRLAVGVTPRQGVREQDTQAFALFYRAAKAGHAEAQFILSRCYHWGHGVQADQVQAFDWLRKSVDAGYAEAQFMLGACYQEGDGVPQDFAEAKKWYLKAAEQGNAQAQIRYGHFFWVGVSRDWAESVKWYRKAADQDAAEAQSYLATAYLHGNGIAKDVIETYKWFKLAADQGDERGAEELASLSHTLGPKQLKEGERRCREFRAARGNPT